MSLDNVQTVALACFLEIEKTVDTFVELRMWMLCGMVENVIGDEGDVRVGQLEVDWRHIQASFGRYSRKWFQHVKRLIFFDPHKSFTISG